MDGSRKYIIANWKMNGTLEDWVSWAQNACVVALSVDGVSVVLAVPSIAMPIVSETVKNAPTDNVFVAAQDVHSLANGAHTGCVSIPMVQYFGATYTLIAHSERRDEFSESPELISAKVSASLSAGLKTVLCFGEQGAERGAGIHLQTVTKQLDEAVEALDSADTSLLGSLLLAYEPVWAISTSKGSLGRQPEKDELIEIFDAIRLWSVNKFGEEIGAKIPLLYGGSVKSSTIKDALSVKEITGVLVGGASLNNEEFAKLITNA